MSSEDDDRKNFPEDYFECCPACGGSHLKNEACEIEEGIEEEEEE